MIALTWMVLTLGLFLLPAAAAADTTCARPQALSDFELRGLPRVLEPATQYRIVLDLPRGDAIARARLTILRCPAVGPEVDGDLFEVFPGVDSGGTYEFAVRFARPGRWRLVAFDRNGLFHDLGFLNVAQPVARDGSGEGDDALLPIVIAVVALTTAGAALMIWRRRIQ